jgi:glutamate N-acetyltransferase/amino-acid N-acetyltransferase
MESSIEPIEGGTVTSPAGFQAAAAHAGIRYNPNKFDLGLLYSEAPCAAAAVYTANRVRAAPLLVTEEHLADGRAQAVIANSGCANAATGRRGLEDARAMARLAARKLGLDASDVAVASTGVIGTFLPMAKIEAALETMALGRERGLDFSLAIMTTDTRPKHLALRFGPYTLGAAAKGAGMIHPNMATMLCFLTTDAPVAQPFLQRALREAVDDSFNLIDVDSDTSTNDMVLVMANGLAGGEPIDEGHPLAGTFREALLLACQEMGRAIVADAEGATRVIQVTVVGAASRQDARRAAREVVRSLGVKTAIKGADPNWGRIVAAVGNSGCELDLDRLCLWLLDPDGNDLCLFCLGQPEPFDAVRAKELLRQPDVRFRIDLGLGEGAATAWGSDLTEDYVRLNSLYTT